MRKFLAEALKDPEDNKMYIEDLHLSIAVFERFEREEKFARGTKPQVEVSSGFAITG